MPVIFDFPNKPETDFISIKSTSIIVSLKCYWGECFFFIQCCKWIYYNLFASLQNSWGNTHSDSGSTRTTTIRMATRAMAQKMPMRVSTSPWAGCTSVLRASTVRLAGQNEVPQASSSASVTVVVFACFDKTEWKWKKKMKNVYFQTHRSFTQEFYIMFW